MKKSLDIDATATAMIDTKGEIALNELSIGTVARRYDVSTRTLRYYDEIGLLQIPMDGACRVYDEAALCRLRQILVLRRLGVPLKQVAEILDAPSNRQAVDILGRTIAETEDALATSMALRQAQYKLLELLKRGEKSTQLLLEDAAVHLFPSIAQTVKEELKMGDIKLEMTTTHRTVFLPPMMVASARAFAKEPENAAFALLEQWIVSNRLWEIKPDLRIFGFNNPSIPNEQGEYGYEYWVTIPEDFAVEQPLTKRSFCGGLYAAHCIRMGDFHEWKPFYEWANHNDQVQPTAREPEGMWGGLEEHLNAYRYFAEGHANGEPFAQLDLLIPVEEK